MHFHFAVGQGGWPIADKLIPAGSIVDTSTVEWAWLLDRALADGRVPPVNAQALDQATYNKMVAVYSASRVHYGPGITPTMPTPGSTLKL
jgi:hypothetical protein